jgi:superfamily I DNA/RNA helicase
MVDEFQILIGAQYELVKLLSYPENNLLVVW